MLRSNASQTSVDSKMEDTPANYNMANQRVDSIDEESFSKINEEDDEDRPFNRVPFKEDEGFEARPALLVRDLKPKKKKKPEEKSLEFLQPTKRDVNMADAYGGMAKGHMRRPGIKYDEDRLKNSKKITAGGDEPIERADLARLAKSVTGF